MVLLCGNKVGLMALEYFKPEYVIGYTSMMNFSNTTMADLVWIKPTKVLSVHGREIVPKWALERHECYNIHPYLYFAKGKDPIGKALIEENEYASVGLHKMTEKVDEGEVIAEYFTKVTLDSRDKVYEQLYPLYFACFKRFE